MSESSDKDSNCFVNVVHKKATASRLAGMDAAAKCLCSQVRGSGGSGVRRSVLCVRGTQGSPENSARADRLEQNGGIMK